MIELAGALIGWGFTMIASLIGFVFSAVVLIFLLPILALLIFAAVRVLNKMGHSGWWCLLMIFPPLAIVAVWILAFTEWPAERRTVTLYPPRS